MSQSINLLTLSDGFGDSQAVPPWYKDYIKWPEIIKLITRDVVLHNMSRYGAGNEYIIQCLRNNLVGKQAVIVQWARPERLDLVLSDNVTHKNFWDQHISDDPVYSNNILSINHDQYWLSSASIVDGVVDYHKRFISRRQHQLRSQLFVDYAKLLLTNIQHGFLLSETSNYLSETTSKDSNWFWNKPYQGMHEFRVDSKYSDLDLGITQPIPLIHFDFIRQFIQPNFELPWRSESEIQTVENVLHKQYQEALKNKPL